MPGKIDLKRSKNQFMFNLRAGNGQVVLTSERYKSKASAENGIKSLKKCARTAKSFERRTAKNGKEYFVVIAPNGQVIGKSQMYASKSGCANGIKSVMSNCGAKIDDQT